VYVSTLLAQRGSGAWLMSLWRNREFDVVISTELFEELVEVLKRPRIAPKIDQHRQYALLRRLHQDAIWTTGDIDVSGGLPDPDDNMLLGAALETKAGFIVTWDTALFGEYMGVRIIDPDTFISLIVR